MSWEEIKIKGWIPTPRCGISAALDSNKIVIFGGDTNRGKTNEILIFAIGIILSFVLKNLMT